MKEKVANQGITQVLREDASPTWSELHHSSFCGEAHTALRGWRPISAALSIPVPLLFVRGRKTSLINHWASRPIYNRRSIRESMGVVNSIPPKNISIQLAIPLPVDFQSNVTCSGVSPQCLVRLTTRSGVFGRTFTSGHGSAKTR